MTAKVITDPSELADLIEGADRLMLRLGGENSFHKLPDPEAALVVSALRALCSEADDEALRAWMLNRELDIAVDMEDFGDLRASFKRMFGRDARDTRHSASVHPALSPINSSAGPYGGGSYPSSDKEESKCR